MSKQVETKKPTNLDELDAALATEADEIELNDPGNPNDLYFEDGPLAGKRMAVKQLEKESAGEGAVTEEEPTPPANPEAKPDQAAAPTSEDKPAEGVEEKTPPAETPPAVETTPATQTPAYQPNLKMKVYDQEKDFPDWAKPLATSKEAEENLRTVLQKSEAFETQRGKLETTSRDRDFHKSANEEHIERVRSSAELQEKNLPAWLRVMGVDTQSLIKYAADLAHLQDTNPAAYAEHLRSLDVSASEFNQSFATRKSNQTQADIARQANDQAIATALSAPEVASFRARMEAVHGAGSFEARLRERGSFLIQNERRYETPQNLAAWVMSTWAQSVPPVAAVPPATPTPVPVSVQHVTPPAAPNGSARPPVPQRVKTLPNLGRGTNASPTRVRPKSFADLEKVIESDLG